MQPISAIDKHGKEFKGILRKENNCGGVRFNKQTKNASRSQKRKQN